MKIKIIRQKQTDAGKDVGGLADNNVNMALSSKKTVRKTDQDMRIAPPPKYCAEDIKRIRIGMGVSQKVFAACLNIPQRTVEAWEAGKSHPSKASARLVQIMELDKEAVRMFCTERDSGTLGSILEGKLEKKDYDKMLPIIKRLEKGSATPAELREVMRSSESTVRRCMEMLVKTGCVKAAGNTSRRIYEADLSDRIILPVHRKNTN